MGGLLFPTRHRGLQSCLRRGVNTDHLSARACFDRPGLALGVLSAGAARRPFERQVADGTSVRIRLRQLDAKTKIRSIVGNDAQPVPDFADPLARFVFPVFSFYKNFTMLACFLLGGVTRSRTKALRAGAGVARCLALFVGAIMLLHY